MKLPKLPEFTREAKTVAGVAVAGLVVGTVVALAVPFFTLYYAGFRAEATIVEAIAAAEADKIRAMGFYRADTSCTDGAALLLDLKAIERAAR